MRSDDGSVKEKSLTRPFTAQFSIELMMATI